MRKLDIFNHIWPKAFHAKLEQTCKIVDITKRSNDVPMMVDLDERFRVMDLFEGYQQVLSLASPPLEVVAPPDVATELARIGNDGMAELVDRYPERFPAFVASIAMSDMDAALAETERALDTLGAAGVQIFTNVNGRPLDEPEFRPFFELMHERDKPIWVHPARGAKMADYPTEDVSKYEIWWTFGWPYETSVFLARMVFSKTMDALPNLKIITHHAGGMVPFFEGRVGPGWDQLGSRTSSVDYRSLLKELKKRPIDYFRDFYADTATFGSKAAIECALAFFGIDHMLFSSDAPFDPEKGPMYIRETIRCIDAMDLSDEDRHKIYHRNAERLLGLAQ
ncbi:MAG: amidohydrolase [Gammaproteobacteria bacterium]|nr:amidohydrolase [Gammaproteobacteria bacterium]